MGAGGGGLSAPTRPPGTELTFGRIPVEKPIWTGGRNHGRNVQYPMMLSAEEHARLGRLTRLAGTGSGAATVRLGLLLLEAGLEQQPERLALVRDEARLGMKA